VAHYGCGQQKTHIFNKQIGVNMNIPAFPTVMLDKPEGGMTLRDYFAAKAMVGLMAMERAQQYITEDGIEMDYEEEGDIGTLFVHTDLMAQEAYMIADMMLKARQE
jgi:hypothetical protein